VVECNRRQVDNGDTYLRELVFGDPEEPHHRRGLELIQREKRREFHGTWRWFRVWIPRKMADSYAAAMRVIRNANWCGSRAAAGRPVGCSYGIVVDRCCCRIRGATFARPDRPSRASAVDGGGHAVDFYMLDGHLLTGADGESI
jgi:hypothetical protein